MASSSSKRRDLSVGDKLDILKQFDSLPPMSQHKAALQLGISQPLLCKMLKQRNLIENSPLHNEDKSRKRKRHGKDKEVESALTIWFTQVRDKDARVNGPLIRQKAEELAEKMGRKNFKATDGWFSRWRKRENIVYGKPHEGQRNADLPVAKSWLDNQWPSLISEYSADCIYNANETALYYRAIPEAYVVKNENVKGCKTSKERVTVLCCASMSGQKQKLLVIGKTEKPKCFQNVRSLPVDYCANQNAWMTTQIFTDWLTNWDRSLERNILLFINKCTPHNADMTFNHIKVVFLPAYTTSLIQPCDQGIIKTLKAYYRTEMRRRIMDELPEDLSEQSVAAVISRKTNLLTALHLLAQSWQRVTASTIQNCFRKGGFISESNNSDTFDETIDCLPTQPTDLSPTQFMEWVDIDDNVATSATLTEDDICASIIKMLDDSDDETVKEELGTVKPPNNKEIKDALSVLTRAVQCRADDFDLHYKYEKFINNLIREHKQTKITDFFK